MNQALLLASRAVSPGNEMNGSGFLEPRKVKVISIKFICRLYNYRKLLKAFFRGRANSMEVSKNFLSRA